MPGLSYQQLMTVPQIMRVVKKLHKPTSFFQDFFKMGPGDANTMTSDLRTMGYDIYANTRTMAPVTAPMAPPPRVGRKPIGTAIVNLLRLHAAITIADEEVYRSRPVGGQLGTVDSGGQKYIKMQLEHLTQMFANSREFMVSRMFRGGFGIKPGTGSRDQFRLCELSDGAATMLNDYLIPAANKTDLGGIIAGGEKWNLSNAPIHEHLLQWSAYQARVSGFVPKNVFVNANTIAPLFTNTVLQAMGGTAMRIFDGLTYRPVKEGEAPTSGILNVVFRGIPQYNFYVYSEGLVLDEVIPNEDNQINSSNFVPFIPDGKAIITPDPGPWCGYIGGKEPVAENVNDPGKVVAGFHMWRTRAINPPRYDLTAVDNGCPALFYPYVIGYADVW